MRFIGLFYPVRCQTPDYTPIYGGRQVRISVNYEIKIPEDDPVVLLCKEMERLDYTRLCEAYSRDGRSPAVSPKVMFMREFDT